MSYRSGIGYDSHRLVAGRPLILGGVEISGAEKGLDGHSDADVLTHAVIDSLLGAAGLGDIGRRYPDTDEQWRDADSMGLLQDSAAAVRAEGYELLNVDATVICEAPKLAPHREAMESALAWGADCDVVNVKFTTNEAMGFVGRGEGIAALATSALGITVS